MVNIIIQLKFIIIIMSVPYHEIREGNRGGRDLFSWEDIRLVSYKDREMYLGHTSKLGFLDKGGKWRKRDWWATGKQHV
jgi:hypothetical protein